MAISGLGTLPREPQVGGGGRRGCERRRGHSLKQETWPGRFPSGSESWYSSFHVLKTLKSLLGKTNDFFKVCSEQLNCGTEIKQE